MSTLELHHGGGKVDIDHDAVLRALNLNPKDANTQALLLVCERYGLDPLLKHMVLISGKPYVTRDGYLSIAHASGVFDGIEVIDEGETDTHYTAKVSVYRKDMSRPTTYTGRYLKSSRMAKDYGPEMAVKCAEVATLRRAFNVTGIGAADERWDAEAEHAREVDERAELRARWDDLKARTGALDGDDAAVLKKWAAEVGLTWGSFTVALADTWESMLPVGDEHGIVDAEVVEAGAATLLHDAAEAAAEWAEGQPDPDPVSPADEAWTDDTEPF